ncbi:unnamed protein product [Heterobilharzia americana]|nr:unnamed protein product [Heterobilharzia americana]
MECYCTPSAANCGEDGRKKCDRNVSHCLLSLRWHNESNRHTEHIQDCWPWSPDDSDCPRESGLCYLLSESKEKFTNCCCKGPLCNGVDKNTIIHPPSTQFNRSGKTTGLDPIFTQNSRPLANTPLPSQDFYTQHKDSFLALIITAPIIAGLLLIFIFAVIVLFLPRYRVCRLKQSLKFPRKHKICTHCRKSSSLLFNPFHSLTWLPNKSVELCSMVKKVELKAHGRFGQVWLGQFSSPINNQNNLNSNSSQLSLDKHNKEIDVAIKIFTSTEKRSWETEVGLFNVPGLEHTNILKYYGADQVVVNNSIGENKLEYWLITEYHPLGSVYDYLHVYSVQWIDLLKICIGIAQGLAHLHMEIPSLSKPSIAHRDLNSRNVLLKANLTACIADFGLAIRFEAGQCMRDAHLQLGTRRYMAPEVLDGAIQFSKDAFLRIDVYAMGLVFWELMMRCCCGSNRSSLIHVSDYLAPFEIELGPQPSMEGLQRWIAHAKQRPKFNPQWASDVGLCTLWETVEECWDQDAEARLSAGCVTKRLTGLLRQSILTQQLSDKTVNSNHHHHDRHYHHNGDIPSNGMDDIKNGLVSTPSDANQRTDLSSCSTFIHTSKNVRSAYDIQLLNCSSINSNPNCPGVSTTPATMSTTACPPTICLPNSLNTGSKPAGLTGVYTKTNSRVYLNDSTGKTDVWMKHRNDEVNFTAIENQCCHPQSKELQQRQDIQQRNRRNIKSYYYLLLLLIRTDYSCAKSVVFIDVR